MLYYYDHTPQDDPAGTTAVLPAAEPEPEAAELEELEAP